MKKRLSDALDEATEMPKRIWVVLWAIEIGALEASYRHGLSPIGKTMYVATLAGENKRIDVSEAFAEAVDERYVQIMGWSNSRAPAVGLECRLPRRVGSSYEAALEDDMEDVVGCAPGGVAYEFQDDCTRPRHISY